MYQKTYDGNCGAGYPHDNWTAWPHNPAPVPTSLDAFQIDHTYNIICLESTV
jgi:hypothetical protein